MSESFIHTAGDVHSTVIGLSKATTRLGYATTHRIGRGMGMGMGIAMAWCTHHLAFLAAPQCQRLILGRLESMRLR